eukprot:391448-Rhodomonas_salina.5
MKINGTQCDSVSVWVAGQVAFEAKRGKAPNANEQEEGTFFPLVYDGSTMLKAFVRRGDIRPDTHILCALWHHLATNDSELLPTLKAAFPFFLSVCRTQPDAATKVCHVFIPKSRLGDLFQSPSEKFPIIRRQRAAVQDARHSYYILSTPLSDAYKELPKAFLWCEPLNANSMSTGWCSLSLAPRVRVCVRVRVRARVRARVRFTFNSWQTHTLVTLLLQRAFANVTPNSDASQETQMHQRGMAPVLAAMAQKLPAHDSTTQTSQQTSVTVHGSEPPNATTSMKLKIDLSGAKQRFHFDVAMLVTFPTLLLVELFLWECRDILPQDATRIKVVGFYELIPRTAHYTFSPQATIEIVYVCT